MSEPEIDAASRALAGRLNDAEAGELLAATITIGIAFLRSAQKLFVAGEMEQAIQTLDTAADALVPVLTQCQVVAKAMRERVTP